MKIALAQINPTVGALDNNSRKIEEIIQEYSPKCDLIVFPEMCLTGYPPQDLLMDTAFIAKTAEALKNIADKVQETPVILGTIRQVEDKLFNTAAVLHNGQISAFRDKTHLPTYDVFDEDRYFTSADSRMPVNLNLHGRPVKLGIEICEDLWDEDYLTKVSRELIHVGAEILVNISASPFQINRLDERLDIIKDKSKDNRSNLAGVIQEEYTIDNEKFSKLISRYLHTYSAAFQAFFHQANHEPILLARDVAMGLMVGKSLSWDDPTYLLEHGGRGLHVKATYLFRYALSCALAVSKHVRKYGGLKEARGLLARRPCWRDQPFAVCHWGDMRGYHASSYLRQNLTLCHSSQDY